MELKERYTFDEFEAIIRRLRAKDGCPWDREQTHQSLRSCMIEEAYEVAEGIDVYAETGDDHNLCEELGDVLLQVLMHAEIAKEEGRFDVNDVITGISRKMIERHPHVFGSVKAETSQDVLENWEQIKKREKHEETISDGMRRVAKSLPATIRAEKIQKKASKVGFDFPDYLEASQKITEELNEVLEAVNHESAEKVEEEYGDLAFSLVNLGRFLNVNTENALTKATEKFINRFDYIEKTALNQGKNLENMSLEDMDEIWNDIKHQK